MIATSEETTTDVAPEHASTPTPGEGRLAIDLSNVEKTYAGRVRALRGISMRVRTGEVFGLLGPNGAGKSTLVKILMTVIRASRCEGTLLGDPVGEKSTLARVGYLPEHHRFPPYQTGRQILNHVGAMSGVPRARRRAKIGELLDLVGMTPAADRKIGGYSKGMRQRIGIAQALINDPELVLLDEPTDGVDPSGRRDIRGVCARLKNEGKTVFINSHLLSELEMVCDRVAILVDGRVRSQGTLDELAVGQEGYEIILGGEAEAARPALEACLADGGAVGGSPRIEGATLTMMGADERSVQPVLRRLIKGGSIVRSVRPIRPSLEDLFLQAVDNDESPDQLAEKNGGAS